MYAYLTMTVGSRVGINFLLDAAEKNRIGRGTDCDIIVSDPLCSRVHASISLENQTWHLLDHESRNGTYVSGKKIEKALLTDGCLIQFGSTRYTFHLSDHPPSDSSVEGANVTQTLIKQEPIHTRDTRLLETPSSSGKRRENDVLGLHELAVKLLPCDDPDEVIQISLELLSRYVQASVVEFLWVSDDGQLKPKQIIPAHAQGHIPLSQSLTEAVCRQQHAVWIAKKINDEDEHSLKRYADAICIPLVHQEATHGAIHIYREQGKFHPKDFDFLISLAKIFALALVRSRKQAVLQTSHLRLVDKSADFSEMIGQSETMQQLKSKISRIAQATGCVLIRGPSGSGKELVAGALHKAGTRADRPMLSVNCAAIPVELMESQLFGHKKGAFSGAESNHLGLFLQADSGTLFLDEVGELTLSGQAKLLRILEGHPFLPVGASEEINVDVRVLAATNRDLQELVREKTFREDLYYRLSVFELYVPPLHDRGTDIGLLLDHFLEHFKKHHGRPHLQLSPAAREKLLAYRWPGNIRQLRNVIDSSVVLAESNTLEIKDLGLRESDAGGLDSLRIDDWQRKLIIEALSRTGGKVPESAKLLGIGRATLYRKIEEYDIPR